jgi:trk system potassium uptake protein TrkA
VIGKHLNQINLPRRCTLALIIRGDETIFPSGETPVMANDEVYALLTRESEEELRRTFGAA